MRRLALTSIVLALAIVAAAGAFTLGISDRPGAEIELLILRRGGPDLVGLAGDCVAPLAAMVAASLACWMRFRIPAAMGLAAATAAALALALLIHGFPAAAVLAKPLVFSAGAVVFAFAMRGTFRTLRGGASASTWPFGCTSRRRP